MTRASQWRKLELVVNQLACLLEVSDLREDLADVTDEPDPPAFGDRFSSFEGFPPETDCFLGSAGARCGV